MLLFTMVAAMIGLQLADYLTRKPDAESESARFQDALRRSVLTSEIAQKATPRGLPIEEAGAPERVPGGDAFDPLIEELGPKRSKSPELTLIYVAAQVERGEPVDPKDLERLRTSKAPHHRAAAEIYAADALELATAEELAGRVRDAGYAGRLAAVHALEKAGDKSARRGLVSNVHKVVVALFGLAALGGLLAGTGLLIYYWTAYRTRKLVPLGHPAGSLGRADAERFALRAAQLFAAPILVSILVGLVFGSRRESPALGALVSVLTLLATWALFRLPIQGVPVPLGRIGLKVGRFRTEALWGLGGLVGNLPLLAIGAVAGLTLFRSLPQPEHPISGLLRDSSNPLAIGLIFVSAVFAAPLFEEVLFRGTLLPALSSFCKSPFWGIVLSSLIFAAIHPTGIPAWPLLASIGIACAVLTYQTRSLVPAIVLHAVHNGLVLTIGLVGL